MRTHRIETALLYLGAPLEKDMHDPMAFAELLAPFIETAIYEAALSAASTGLVTDLDIDRMWSRAFDVLEARNE